MFRIEWSSGFRETYEFRTSIITHRAGQEQRIAYRSRPRRSYEFNAFMDPHDLRKIMARYSVNQGELVHFPHPRDFITLATSIELMVDSTQITITVPSVPGWLVANAVVFLRTADRPIRGEVVSVTSNQVVIDFEPFVGRSTGKKIFRGIAARPNTTYGLRALTSRVGTVPVNMLADPVMDWHRSYSMTPVVQLDGREYFNMDPDWANGVEVNIPNTWEDIDFQRGAVDRINAQQFPIRTSRFRFLLYNASRIEYLLGMFHRVRGRQKSFWMPSHIHEIQPIADIAAGDDSFDVLGSDVFDAYADSTVFKYLRFRTLDGDYIMEVDDVTKHNDNTRITLVRMFAVAIPLVRLQMISWITRCRLESDSLSINWRTDELGDTDLSVRTVEAA